MTEKKRRIGKYTVQERTAHRMIIEARGDALVALLVLGGTSILFFLVTAPWRGGTRLLITITLAGIVLAATALILFFVPYRRRIVVDMEEGVCRAERLYLPRFKRTVEARLEEIGGVQYRPLVWQDGTAEAVRWVVELQGTDRVYRVARGEDAGTIQEIAQLIAEVTGRTLLQVEEGPSPDHLGD